MLRTVALVVGLMTAGVAGAATIVARDTPWLARNADAIVEAEVVAVEHQLGADGRPWTHNRLRVAAWWKGTGPVEIDVEQLGGPFPDGRILHIDGDLALRPGQKIVAFLDEQDGHLGSLLLGWSVFEVGPDGALRRHHADFGLVAPDPIGRLAPVAPAAVATPRHLSALRVAVRAALEAK